MPRSPLCIDIRDLSRYELVASINHQPTLREHETLYYSALAVAGQPRRKKGQKTSAIFIPRSFRPITILNNESNGNEPDDDEPFRGGVEKPKTGERERSFPALFHGCSAFALGEIPESVRSQIRPHPFSFSFSLCCRPRQIVLIYPTISVFPLARTWPRSFVCFILFYSRESSLRPPLRFRLIIRERRDSCSADSGVCSNLNYGDLDSWIVSLSHRFGRIGLKLSVLEPYLQ